MVYENIKIYPNPTTGIVEINLADHKINKLSIIDLYGRIIIENIPANQNETIDLSGFANGVYFIMLEKGEEVRISKIIKE